MIKNRKNWGLITILFIAFILRFYNLMHDAPYFFNPDERNMAAAITRFVLPGKLTQIPACVISEFRAKPDPQPATDGCSLNPQFFAYGQFPLYLAFASDQLVKAPLTLLSRASLTIDQGVPLLKTSFASAIFWLRFWSALTSLLTVYAVYLIAQKLFSIGHFSALLAAFSPGLIQSAHFGTTEALLTFFFLVSIYYSLRLADNFPKNTRPAIPLVFSVGASIGSKLTGLFFLIPPLLTLLILAFKRKHLLKHFFLGLTIVAGSLTIGFLSSFYNLVESKNFQSAVFGYEQDVAMGKYEAFYTRQFIDSKPIIFQMEKIFPYTLGWPVFILGTLGFVWLILSLIFAIRKKSKFFIYSLILLITFLAYLIPNAILYAKWTRFMTPVFPLIILFAGFSLYQIRQKFKLNQKVNWLIHALSVAAILPGFFFMSIYAKEDSRLTASKWIYDNIPEDAYILSETANVVDIPLGIPDYPATKAKMTVISFDFYHLHENPLLFTDLVNHLEKAQYIFMPSRRIWKNYTLEPQKYQIVNTYYQKLFSGELGFDPANETTSYPAVSLGPLALQFPDEDAEETFTVFDHPVIRIFKKVTPYSTQTYRNLLSL